MFINVCVIQRSGRTPRTVMFAETAQAYPSQALLYLDHMMACLPCRKVLLEHNRPALRSITDCLKNITVCLSLLFAARCYAERGCEIACRPSVCLSVCDALQVPV